MTAALYCVIYACAAVFVIACVARAVRYARLPLHLRWELYPVPHEAPERAAHGGSYFEEPDWWTRPARRNRAGEWRAMLVEIVFLKGLWEYNRKLWLRSFPFHFGLYLVTGSLCLLAVGAPRILYLAPGLAGTVLVILGSAALLERRLRDPELRPYTTPGDVFNLLFFLVTFLTLAAGYAGPRDAGIAQIARGVLAFDTSLAVPPLLAAGLILGALLAAYIPLTHMSHFIAKYFTYHAVRWDDAPAARRLQMQKRVAAYLAMRPTWSARHIGADGTKTWADIAAEVKK